MTPEVIASVDAWADSNIAWVDADLRRQCLVLAWKNLTNEAAVSSYPYSDALRQAAAGILLALVREVWGSGCYVAPEIGGGWRLSGANLRGQSVQMQPCATEVECLVFALVNSTAAMEPQ